MSKRRILIGGGLLGLVVAAVVAGAIFYGTDARARNRLLSQLNIEPGPADSRRLVASGFIEAEEIDLAPEIGGRVVALPYAEGEEVAVGEVVVRLDIAILEAHRDAARAQLAIAEAERDLLAAGVRDEVIREAEAQLAIAQAAVGAAGATLQGAVAVRDNPQDLQVRVAEAAAQVQTAQHEVNAANAQLLTANKQLELFHAAVDGIDKYLDFFREDADEVWVPLEQAQAPNRYSTALRRVEDAQTALDRAGEVLAATEGLAADPQQLQARVIDAQTSVNTASAEVQRAQAQLEDLSSGPREEQLRVAEGRVAEAQAALDAVETQIGRMTLIAPIGGVVLERPLHVGELAMPGVTAMRLANLDMVDLTVYLTAGQLNLVALNQRVEVQVDSFPERVFEGTVVTIADEAEFTPRSVQTREERVNLVYAVKIRLENPDHALKPGMPADVFFGS
jgi:HlyD family secretion protein